MKTMKILSLELLKHKIIKLISFSVVYLGERAKFLMIPHSPFSATFQTTFMNIQFKMALI